MTMPSDHGFVREIDLPPDPFELARRLADRPGLALLVSDPRGAWSKDDAQSHFVAVDPVEGVTGWLPQAGPPRSAKGWAGLAAAPRWIGVLPYEAARGLERPAWRTREETRPSPSFATPTWHRYDAVVRIDRATGRVAIEADDAAAAQRLANKLRRCEGASSWAPSASKLSIRDLAFDDSDADHAARVARVLRYIAAGDVYQVNVARRISFRAEGDPLELFRRLFLRAPSPYGFYLRDESHAVCGGSPELALEIRGELLRTMPIKGTRPRGADAVADRALCLELDADPKERAELTMAIDLHRNDVGRVARAGSVRVQGPPRVLTGRTVHSRVASVVARREASIDEVVRAVIPCGSVTGAPKVRAMEIIAELESSRRGLYTGAFGYVGRDGAVVLAMAIRTAVIDAKGEGEYFAGGGIVAGSDPSRETEETRWKAAQLLALGS